MKAIFRISKLLLALWVWHLTSHWHLPHLNWRHQCLTYLCHFHPFHCCHFVSMSLHWFPSVGLAWTSGLKLTILPRRYFERGGLYIALLLEGNSFTNICCNKQNHNKPKAGSQRVCFLSLYTLTKGIAASCSISERHFGSTSGEEELDDSEDEYERQLK